MQKCSHSTKRAHTLADTSASLTHTAPLMCGQTFMALRMNLQMDTGRIERHFDQY